MAGQSRPARVLLIGESVDEREMYGEALRLEGFCTLQAADASTASRMIAELHPSAVVVSDGRLDYGFGVSTVRQLAAHTAGAGVRVLMLTSHARLADLQAARSAGCHEVIVKPCLPETLIRHLGELMNSAADATGPTS